MNPRESFLGWPGWRILGVYVLLSAAINVWWLLIFGGANYLTTLHSYRVRLHCDAELDIPFVPASVLVYMSIYLLFWAVPFILRSVDELLRLTATFAAITLVAAVGFLIFPADPCFRTPDDLGIWTELVWFAKWIAMRHNFAPSLHVGLSIVCITVYARRARPLGKAFLWLWALAIALSTMFLHQHYAIDVLTGFLLGWGGVRLVYDRLSWPGESAPASPSTSRGPPA